METVIDYLARIANDPLAMLTVILIGVLVWHALLFRGTLQLSTDSAQRELRAYVGIKEATVVFRAGITGSTPIPQSLVARIQFVNAGQTPAIDISNRIGLTIAPYPLQTSLPPTNVVSAITTVMPHIDWTQESGDDLSEEQVRLLESAEHAVWVFGRVDYKIVFGPKRGQMDTKTTCYRFFKQGPIQFGSTLKLHAHDEGNNAT